MANETRSEQLKRSEVVWRRLLNEGVKPYAEELAPILAAGKIAIVVFEPNESAKPVFRAMGWDGKAAVFPMSNAVRERLAKIDTVTAAWVNRKPKPTVGRLFVCSGIGTLLVNSAPGRGFWIEPGSLESEWV